MDSPPTSFRAIPPSGGLYDPALEKDACGVGFIANFKSQPSHGLVQDALVMLHRMDHRGGCGCEPNTGDGAGIMMAMPHLFVHRCAREAFGKDIGSLGSYAVGNIFLPHEEDLRQRWKQRLVALLKARGMDVIGWRRVPTDNSMIGPSAKKTEPFIEQIFVENSNSLDPKAFDLQLYVVKQSYAREVQTNHMAGSVYVCTLSSQTIVYKGQLRSSQIPQYYLDLQDPEFASHFALVHSRFSTNTFPSWDRAHPNRVICHNGEINTLRGNKNWMFAREGNMESPLLGKGETELLLPICSDEFTDSGNFDASLELLAKASDRSLPEAVMMMLPEAWQNDDTVDADKRAFYEYNSCNMEPWDGPAMIAFADGRFLGCVLDRNGLRPHRYYVTDDIVVAASEVGVIPDLKNTQVVEKGRLQPGKMFLVDFERKGIVRDSELKRSVSTARPYKEWVKNNLMRLDQFIDPKVVRPRISLSMNGMDLSNNVLNMFGYSVETIEMLIPPMVENKKEALGSMGVDTPLACLSSERRLLFDYFKQLFAQVTNPPMDSIREEVVMAMECPVGPEGNLLEVSESQAKRLIIKHPVLNPYQAQALVNLTKNDWKTVVIDCTYSAGATGLDLDMALQRICADCSEAVDMGATAVMLSDRSAGPTRMPIPSLLLCGAVHHHLTKEKKRSRIALIIEGGDCREVHHFCCLIGFGADAIYPYMAYECIDHLVDTGKISGGFTVAEAIDRYIIAAGKGIRKVMGKMGIATVQSYKGAQIFEAVGIGQDLIRRCFVGTASRIGGITLDTIHTDIRRTHEVAWPRKVGGGLEIEPVLLQNPGEFHYRDGGEVHYNNPEVIVGIQESSRTNNRDRYKQYAAQANTAASKTTIRGLLQFKHGRKVPLDQVEPAQDIVKRFVTGAMSYGSISKEAHETLAIAMNRLGGKSNTGEGGEDPYRFSWTGPNGEKKRSAIKQVASGRFGVTSNYLANSDEIQIKMAQGAKPGEGGELPGHKVAGKIAEIRNSTEGVGLISPPPHHDIYSIEDLAQLIHDLKNANRYSRVSVKLVSEVGVGVVAAGVAKAKADHIVISGHDGGTGAAAWTGVKHCGLPWELGLAEAQQTLVLNNLRGRVVLQTDGQMKTGRDVAVAFLLGAEEVAFATAPLIALGCIMMRKCHLNTCPVGIATQDPELRAKFKGQPEDVVNFFFMLAEEVREYMSTMGFRTVDDMVGRSDMLEVNPEALTYKTRMMDLSNLLLPAHQLAMTSPHSLVPSSTQVESRNFTKQDHELDKALDQMLMSRAAPALDPNVNERVIIESRVGNINRTVGTMLSYEVSKRFGKRGLPDGSIHVRLTGSAGQSLGAFLAPGITIECIGDANDYCGKGLSGGVISVYPDEGFASPLGVENNMIVGNVSLYGATRGRAYFSGMAGERFCVRNSGAVVVVEGVGDHGCEYMTGGRVTILGKTGRNFGAGMSGGLAFVLDEEGVFESLCNLELIGLEKMLDIDIQVVKKDIEDHVLLTGSKRAKTILENWDAYVNLFVKVYPRDLKRVLESKAADPKFKLPVWVPQIVVPGAEDDSDVLDEPESQPESGGLVLGGVSDIEDVGKSGCTAGLVEATVNKSNTAGELVVARRNGTRGKLGKLRGFIEYERNPEPYRDPAERIKDYAEINLPTSARPDLDRKRQAARCMDCGTPFCQTYEGCPVNNLIPEFNNLVYKDQWKDAIDRLHKTNNFPEFTGRVCPAPCEGSCVAGLVEQPVTIKNIEYAIVDRAFAEGWIIPRPPKRRTGKTVAVVGSGPSGLACADQLNKMGHTVTVFERDDRLGGLLMYGIPNMKLEKNTVDRRVNLLRDEGVKFITNAHVGVDPRYGMRDIRATHDALVLTVGSTKPRDLRAPGRELKGIHFAMDFLTKNTKTLLDDGQGRLKKWDGSYITAKGKNVVVIGGGDTGCDCIGTSVRHGCNGLVNLELLPQPPAGRATDNPWPHWPKISRVDYGHEEVLQKFGKDPREYCVLTKEFVGDGNGNVKAVRTVVVDWQKRPNGGFDMREIPGSLKEIPADLVILSMGFLGPEPAIVKSLGLKVDKRSNIKAQYGKFATSEEGVFAAGDCRRGQSLVVWAINEGRGAADAVGEYLSTKVPAHL